MQQTIERDQRIPDTAAHGDGNGMQRFVQVRMDASRQICRELLERAPDHVPVEIEEFRRVRAGLNDDVIGLPHDEQSAVRLDRTGEMNLLSLAVRQVGLPEGRHREGTRGQVEVSRSQLLSTGTASVSPSRP